MLHTNLPVRRSWTTCIRKKLDTVSKKSLLVLFHTAISVVAAGRVAKTKCCMLGVIRHFEHSDFVFGGGAFPNGD